MLLEDTEAKWIEDVTNLEKYQVEENGWRRMSNFILYDRNGHTASTLFIPADTVHILVGDLQPNCNDIQSIRVKVKVVRYSIDYGIDELDPNRGFWLKRASSKEEEEDFEDETSTDEEDEWIQLIRPYSLVYHNNSEVMEDIVRNFLTIHDAIIYKNSDKIYRRNSRLFVIKKTIQEIVTDTKVEINYDFIGENAEFIIDNLDACIDMEKSQELKRSIFIIGKKWERKQLEKQLNHAKNRSPRIELHNELHSSPIKKLSDVESKSSKEVALIKTQSNPSFRAPSFNSLLQNISTTNSTKELKQNIASTNSSSWEAIKNSVFANMEQVQSKEKEKTSSGSISDKTYKRDSTKVPEIANHNSDIPREAKSNATPRSEETTARSSQFIFEVNKKDIVPPGAKPPSAYLQGIHGSKERGVDPYRTKSRVIDEIIVDDSYKKSKPFPSKSAFAQSTSASITSSFNSVSSDNSNSFKRKFENSVGGNDILNTSKPIPKKRKTIEEVYEAYSKSIAEPVKPNDQRIFCNYCHTRFKSPKCTNLRHVDGELVLIESNLSERSDPSLKAGKRDEVSYNRGFHEKKAECTTRSQERNLEDRSVHFNKRPSEFYGRNFSDREVSNRGNDFVNRDVGYRRRDINDRDVGYRNRDYSQRLVDGGQRHNPQMSSAYGNSTADESYYKKQNSWENLSRKYDDRSSQGYQNIGEVRGRDSWMPKNTNIGNVKKDDLSASIGKSSSYTSADYQKVDKNDVMKIISRWTNVDKSYSDTLEKIGYQVNHDGSNGSIEKLSNSAENYSKSQDKQIKYLQCESHEPSFQITDLGRKKNLEGYDKISNVYRLANSNYTFPDQSSGDSETKNIKIEQKKNSKGFGVEWADIMGKELMVLHRFSKDVEFEPEDPTNYSDPNLVDEDCEEEVCETTPFLYLPRHI